MAAPVPTAAAPTVCCCGCTAQAPPTPRPQDTGLAVLPYEAPHRPPAAPAARLADALPALAVGCARRGPEIVRQPASAISPPISRTAHAHLHSVQSASVTAPCWRRGTRGGAVAHPAGCLRGRSGAVAGPDLEPAGAVAARVGAGGAAAGRGRCGAGRGGGYSACCLHALLPPCSAASCPLPPLPPGGAARGDQQGVLLHCGPRNRGPGALPSNPVVPVRQWGGLGWPCNRLAASRLRSLRCVFPLPAQPCPAAPACSAAMAILRQQSAFVDELFGSGIVNEVERQAMQARRGGSAGVGGPGRAASAAVGRPAAARSVRSCLPHSAAPPRAAGACGAAGAAAGDPGAGVARPLWCAGPAVLGALRSAAVPIPHPPLPLCPPTCLRSARGAAWPALPAARARAPL